MKIHSNRKLFRNAIKRAREARAVSPIIAIVLLIGLTVIAMALLAVLVFTFLQPNANVIFVSGSLTYDLEETKNQGHGMGLFTITLSNDGQEDAEIVGFKIQYAVGTSDFRDLDAAILTLEGISSADPAIVSPSESKTFHVIFPLVPDNADNEVRYRITYLLRDGTQGEYDPEISYGSLGPDRPTVTYPDLTNGIFSTNPSKFLRRTAALQPTVSDTVGGEWKQVIYTLSNASGIVRQWVIEPSDNPNGYLTNWNTKIGTTAGVANGTYTLNITVIDWAGLSKSITGSVTVDNDYIAPTISVPSHYYEFPNGTKRIEGEVGNSLIVEVDVTDSGSHDSGVASVLLWYRVNTTGYEWKSVTLSKVGGTQATYRGNIPSADVNSDAMDHHIVYFIKAIDKDGNIAYSNASSTNPHSITVIDTVSPDISFNPILSAESGSEFYITTTITDKDQVNDTTVVLYWRWYEDDETKQGKPYANDTNTNNLPSSPIDTTPNDLSEWNTLTVSNQSNSQYSWFFNDAIVKLYGIAYFIEARDRSGNVARDGSPSSPNTIITTDVVSPSVNIQQPSEGTFVTQGESLEVIAVVFDNDPTFSIMGTGFAATGSVILEYRDLPSTTWSSITMTLHPTLNQADGGNTTNFAYWYATIPASAFDPNDGSKDFELRVKATDQSLNPTTISSTLTILVVAPGTPVLEYVSGSAKGDNPSNSTLVFTINNTAKAPATANITAMQFTIRNVSGTTTGTPIATQINTTTTSLWTNTTSNEGINGTKITLATALPLSAGGTTVTFRVRFVSDLANTFNLTGFEINVTLYFTYGSSSAGTASFVITDLIPQTQVLPYIDDFNSDIPGTFPSTRWTKVDPGTPTTWQILDITKSKTGSQSLEVKDVVNNVLTYSYLHVRKFYLPFEITLQYYLDRSEGPGSRIAIIFDSDISDGNFYYAGWRGVAGADDATIGQYNGGWQDSAVGSIGFDHNKGLYDIKVTISSGGTVSVYVSQSGSGSWNLGTQWTINGLPTKLQVGVLLFSMVDFNGKKIKTQLDNFGVYASGQGPSFPPFNQINRVVASNAAASHHTSMVKFDSDFVTLKSQVIASHSFSGLKEDNFWTMTTITGVSKGLVNHEKMIDRLVTT